MKRLFLSFVAFLVISCAPKGSQPTFVPFMVLGSTETPTPPLASPASLLSDNIVITYASQENITAPATFIMVAEYDLNQGNEVFLPLNLGIDDLQKAQVTQPVSGLGVLMREGAQQSVSYTDAGGKISFLITGQSPASFYLPDWTCTEVASWRLPATETSPPVKGGRVACEKN